MVAIPEDKKDLLEGSVVVTLVTLMPDGQPQGTPVWCSYDGTHILINSAKGRQKDHNMRSDPRVTVVAIDPENPYRYLEVRGEVVEITEEGALEHINSLAKQYFGRDDFYAGNEAMRGKETRVIYKVRPTN
jgi:PPOX class probable F420-dependent enzyme